MYKINLLHIFYPIVTDLFFQLGLLMVGIKRQIRLGIFDLYIPDLSV